jgi:nitroimidazol reductase NimA-like FMN-containing flavoprotein (pyridoxamine 5'-phosphate oxidase superfamily)
MDKKGKLALGQIRALFESQALAVLSTQKNDQPYASLVAFATTADLENIIFLTPNTTRKYDHLVNNPKVAILINNSLNQAADIYNAVSVTATGIAKVIESHEKNKLLDTYLKRHPHLKVFSASPTTALIRVSVDRYIMVNRFQNVVEIQVAS